MSAGLLIGRASATRLLRWWGDCKGWPPPPRPFFYPSTSLNQPPDRHPPPRCPPPTSLHPGVFYPPERTAIHAAKCTAIWTSKLPPPPDTLHSPPRCIHRSLEAATPRDDPFRLAYRRSRYQPPSPSRWKGMPRRRRRSRGSYFIPEERNHGA